MEGNSSRRQKGNIVTISRKALRSAEQKRLQRGRGTGKGLEDCGKASIGVQGSAESRGHDRNSDWTIVKSGSSPGQSPDEFWIKGMRTEGQRLA